MEPRLKGGDDEPSTPNNVPQHLAAMEPRLKGGDDCSCANCALTRAVAGSCE